MVSADGRYVLVFNGEIYNYLELRKELIDLGYSFKTQTDTEVLLTSFIHWDEECLQHFNACGHLLYLIKLKMNYLAPVTVLVSTILLLPGK